MNKRIGQIKKFFRQNFFLKNIFPAVIFMTGAAVLVIEVVAIRVLSPYYGNTIFTVSSIITVILAALSFGYYWGGEISDRNPSVERFFKIIMLSGISIVALHFLGALLLPFLSANLSLSQGPLLSALLLFLLPALLLGTLSPYAIKLQSLRSPKQGIGKISGKIFFWSTLGSIMGSLLSGFYLIPHFGVSQIFIANGALLFLLGFIALVILKFDKNSLAKYFVAIILLGFMAFVTTKKSDKVLYSEDGVYEKITIYDGEILKRPARFFQQDRSNSGSMFLDSKDPADLPNEYTKYYSLYKIFNPEVKNALIIGGGIYSIPKALMAELPQANIDVAEIEPKLFELVQKYFNVKASPNLHNYTEDGRHLLQNSQRKYDLVFSDVYYSLFSIPPHFTTKEFFIIAKKQLSENGIFIANLIGDLSRQEPSLIFSEIKTFQSVFPNSYFFAVNSVKKNGSQNIIFFGSNSNKKIDFNSPSILQNNNSTISSLPQKLIDLDRFDLSKYPVLVDDFSPVEYLTATVLKNSLEENNKIDGDEMMAIIDQQLRYKGRYIGSEGHEKTTKFLIAEMQAYSDKVSEQSWNHKGENGKNYKLTNVIGSFFPERKKRIILATHYDSKRLADKDPVDKNGIVLGANDSGSGVAVLIELARVLNNTKINKNIGIDLVFFDGEEGDVNQGSDYKNWKPLGSTYFAQHLNEVYKNDKPQLAIVLDMVCDKDLQIYKESASLKSAKSQVNTFWNIAKQIDKNVFKDETAITIFDDHTELNKAGIPSFLLIDFQYSYHHTTHDTIDKCSADSLEKVGKAVWEYVISNEGF